jgi:hypothetical protein
MRPKLARAASAKKIHTPPSYLERTSLIWSGSLAMRTNSNWQPNYFCAERLSANNLVFCRSVTIRLAGA